MDLTITVEVTRDEYARWHDMSQEKRDAAICRFVKAINVLSQPPTQSSSEAG